MSFFPPVEETSGGFELIPPGVKEAYCFGVVDLGTQPQKPFQGKPKPPRRTLRIYFEFTEELRQFKEGEPLKPMIKFQTYTYFTDEKSSLAKLMKAWLGKEVSEVDFARLAGTPASITIAHETGTTDPSKIYDNMTLIGPMSEKLIPLMPPMFNKPMNFSIMEHGFDSPEFKALYPKLQELIKTSPEYQEYLMGPSAPAADGNSEDPPFAT